MRLRQRKVICVLLLVFTAYIFVQICLYIFVHKKDTELKQDGYLKEFSNFAITHGLPIILIDEDVLKKITSGKSSNGCFLCEPRQLTVFGVLNTLWNHDLQVLRSMKDHGWAVSYDTERDRDTLEYLGKNQQPQESEVVTHYFITWRHQTIQLVVLFEQASGFWWFGATRNPEGLDLKNRFGQQPGAIDKMELVKLKLDGLHVRVPKLPTLFLKQLSNNTFIHCNHTRAKLFYSKHKAEAENDVIFFRDANKNALSTAKKALDSLNIRFWLSSGTCLGWYRQCDTIPYSDDLDIGIWIKDYKPQLISAMQAHGFHLVHILGKEADSYQISFSEGSIKLDIFFFYEEADYMWNGATQVSTRNKFKYIFQKFSLCWTEFLGLKVRVPCETEVYIQANYGLNWFEPVKTWDWKKSPPNVRENGQWPKSESDSVIMNFED